MQLWLINNITLIQVYYGDAVNFLQHVSVVLASFVTGILLVMSSIFNQNIRGLVYLGGVLIACVLNLLLMNVIASPSDPTRFRFMTCPLILHESIQFPA